MSMKRSQENELIGLMRFAIFFARLWTGDRRTLIRVPKHELPAATVFVESNRVRPVKIVYSNTTQTRRDTAMEKGAGVQFK